jgi:hypothetical protein
MVHSASTSLSRVVLQMWLAVLQMQLMRCLVRTLSMWADVPLQLEELRTNSMAHTAWVLSALVKVLSQLEELQTESMVHSALTSPALGLLPMWLGVLQMQLT